MPKKYPTIGCRVDPDLKHLIWKEAGRLKMSPSRWMKDALQRGLSFSLKEPTPKEFVISLNTKEYQTLRKAGYRVSCKPLPEEE